MPLAKRVTVDTSPFRQLLAAIIVIFAILAPSPPARAEESHPGISVEPLYSEAVIAYNKRKSDEALRILNQLLKQDPRHVDALQLKALTLKTMGDDREAIDTYTRLIPLKPAKETGPYHFELGVIYNRQKKPAVAEKHFLRAIALGTNVTASHLFLGIAKFSAGRLSEAETHFDVVSGDSEAELRMIGNYYLGLIHLKNGNGSIGLGKLVEARSIGGGLKDNPTAMNITASTESMLSPFDKGQWFLTANLLPQFDSNVSLTPVAGPAPTGSASLKANAAAGGGWMSSAMRPWQWVGSLRASMNLNSNGTTASSQYASLNPTFYLTRAPLSSTPHGIKIDYTYTVQSTAAADGSYAFRPTYPFAHILDVSPYLRWAPSNRVQYQLDLGVRRHYYPYTSDYSGNTQYARVSGRFETGNRFLNPGATLSLENVDTRGAMTNLIATVDVNNMIRFNATSSLYVDVSVAGYSYYNSTRRDGNLAIHPTYTWNFMPRWSALIDLSYVINTSSDGNFSYNRWTSGVGVSWSLN